MTETDRSLQPFLNPAGVLIVGVSSNPTKLGFGLAHNLTQSGFTGGIHFVNPHGGKLLGQPIYRQISEVPDPVDLAVILVAAPQVPGILEQCCQRGIRSAILASGGFRETGEAGARLEEEILQFARKNGMRLLGPNCVGVIDTHTPIDTTFLPPPGPTSGEVAFISQSGAICAAVIDWARGQGFGLSRLVSMGNQLDIQECDMLGPVAGDPHSRVITLYLEGVRDGRRLVDAASAVAAHMPIVALKVGHSESGRKAVVSHTGALAGDESAYNAAFRRAGIIRANTTEELFDWARALAWCPMPRGRAVAILTNAGGPGVAAADALKANGLCLAELTEHTRQELAAILPPAANTNNPVDMLADASPSQCATSLRLLLDDPGVDSVVFILPPPPMYSAGGIARAMIPVIYSTDKPVLVTLMGERMLQEAVEYFRAAHLPEYRFPERAVSALATLSHRAEFLQRPFSPPVIVHDIEKQTVRDLLRQAGPVSDAFLETETVHGILRAYGVTVPVTENASSAEEASQIANRMGYPIAMKINSPDVIHKSDAGGILLNVGSEAEVRHGFDAIMNRVRQSLPDAVLNGVSIQRMVPGDREVIVGIRQDPQFGPIIMFGAGGVAVEQLGDVAFALAPATESEAVELLAKTRAGRLLDGYRHIPAGDKPAVLNVIYRLGQLASDFPELAEVEINPLRVFSAGQGAIALDVRARVVEIN